MAKEGEVFKETLNKEWDAWRATYSVREVAPAPGGIHTQPEAEGSTAHLPNAKPWRLYWECGDDEAGEVRRECLVVPYANRVGCEGCPAAAKPLAGTNSL